MKILFLSHRFFPDIGGIETNSETLANQFSDAGHEVRLMTWSLDEKHTRFKYEIVRNPSTIDLIREHSWAEVVLENNPCLRLAWPRLIIKRPSTIVINTWIARTDGTMHIQDRLKLWWIAKASSIIAVSNAIRECYSQKATVIGNPYRDDLFKVFPTVYKSRTFVFLGRLVSDKGVNLAIQLIHKLVHSKFNCFLDRGPALTIVGDGPERSLLEKMVIDLKLGELVEFTGPLQGNELAMCLNQHRFMLIPSIWEEPFGNIALEGMACGCVPIGSDGGGLPDAIGNAGIIFKRGELIDLFSCATKLLDDPLMEVELRSRSFEHLKKHQPQKVSKNYLDVIESTLKRGNSK